MKEERAKQLEVRDTVEWIRKNGLRRVALQVPDELLGEAAAISRALCEASQTCSSPSTGEEEEKEKAKEGNEGVKFFVMADTIDGSCHVDEITAQHLTAECVVHYGATYIPEVAKLPVKFVLDKAELDVEHVVSTLLSFKQELKERKCKVVVAYELKYEHLISAISSQLGSCEGMCPLI